MMRSSGPARRCGIVCVMTAWILTAGLGRFACADTPEPEHAAVRARINALIELAQAGNFNDVAKGVAEIKKQVEDTRDFVLLGTLYELMGVAATKLGDRTLEVRGDFQTTILRTRAYGALDDRTVQAEVSLAVTYGQRKFERPLQIVATNALGSIRVLRQEGKSSPDLEQNEAWLHVLLGQSFYRTGRNMLALRHFRRAKTLGQAGALDADEKEGVDRALANLEPTAPSAPRAPAPGACAAGESLTKEQGDECLRNADIAALFGNLPAAESILREMIGDAVPNRLPIERAPAALALHMLLVQELLPDDPKLIHSVLLNGNRLALDEFASASLIALRTMIAVMLKENFNHDLAKLCGHIARRAARGGNEDLALRHLDVQIVMMREAIAKASKTPDEIDYALEQALILSDAASFAELNGYEGLARIYNELADKRIELAASLPFDELREKLSVYWDVDRGYVFPGPAAAAELLGRVAEREPAEMGRANAITVWLSGESLWRSADDRARNHVDRLIAKWRGTTGLEVLVSDLLTLRAGFTDDPLASSKYNREAFELIKDLPNVDNKRVVLMLAMAEDSRQTGDYDTAFRLVDDAQRIAETSMLVELRQRAQIRSWQVRRAARENDLSRAIVVAEEALRLVEANTMKDHYLRIEPAERLADLYAHAGRMEDARKLYNAYVFTEASSPLQAGEAKALDARLGLVSLEAYFSPTPDTLKEIERLMQGSGRSASRDEALLRSLIRVESFAHYGLGDGVAALKAGRRALEMRKNFSSDRAIMKDDRLLLETMIGAAVLTAAKGEVPVRRP